MKFKSMGAACLLSFFLLAGLLGCSQQEQAAADKDANVQADSNANCDWVGHDKLTVVDDMEARLAAYVPTDLSCDLSHLTTVEKQVLTKLVEASKVMNEIFLEQATPCREELLSRIDEFPADQQAGLKRYFKINISPWDRRFHHEPFFGNWEHPAGANYYPLDLTEAEKAQISDSTQGLDGLFTMVRRNDAGELVAIPYSEFFKPQLEKAANLMNEAAELTENASLKAFLKSRAAAFASNDYFESDMLWMDLDGTVEITIGPYETYEDGLFGYKAAFESFVTVTDPVSSARLSKFKDELPWLESNLPLADEHKNLNRGSESPIRVVDEVYSAGDTRTAVQTIAFNLPNDERVREAKGSKKVLLRNVMKAKFDQILVPLANELVVPEQMANLTSESFFLHTLWHEMSHGLGPGKIIVDGRETEVRLELKETYSTLEEAKADAMGEWDIFVLTRAGRDYFSKNIIDEQAATYLAGLFRSVRFGIGEAHGQANAIQYNYLMEKKAVLYHEDSKRYSIDVAVFEKAIESLVAEICLIQAEGDYQGSVDFIKKYGGMTDLLASSLARLEGIPVDLEPVFPDFEK
ncbi:MAG: peptidase [bacterium]|nr:peptidase [bacterium]